MNKKKGFIGLGVLIFLMIVGAFFITQSYSKDEKAVISLLIDNEYQEAEEIYSGFSRRSQKKLSKPITEIFVINKYIGYETDELERIYFADEVIDNFIISPSYWEKEVLSLTTDYYDVHMDNYEMLSNTSCLEKNVRLFEDYSFNMTMATDYLINYVDSSDEFNIDMAKLYYDNSVGIEMDNCGPKGEFKSYKDKTISALSDALNNTTRENLETNISKILDDVRKLENDAKSLESDVDIWYEDYVRIGDELETFSGEVRELKDKHL